MFSVVGYRRAHTARRLSALLCAVYRGETRFFACLISASRMRRATHVCCVALRGLCIGWVATNQDAQGFLRTLSLHFAFCSHYYRRSEDSVSSSQLFFEHAARRVHAISASNTRTSRQPDG